MTLLAKPELLAPAGTLKNMRYAFAYGADAVYAGQPRYSLRVRNNEFDHANLALGIREAQAQGKRFYVVVNIAPHNAKLKTFLKDLAPVIEMAPDALIMSDPGLIMLVRRHFPQMPIHLSVQANTVNWASVEFWQLQGLTRIILSRELSLEEIEEIRQQVPGMELEVFVHGALCMAYSGRCLLSGYMNKRDANQGTCTNACRWKYSAQAATENAVGDIVQSYQPEPTLGLGAPTDQVFLLQEANRPGELMPAFEDEHGTYIMNAKDLRAVQHVFMAVEAYRLLAKEIIQPLHLGITEAGGLRSGTVKSAVGLGMLLAEGIGDTIRISLAADPVEEVKVGYDILKSLHLRSRGINFIACPSCSRQNFDVVKTMNELEGRLEDLLVPLDVAVIGCVVNGPGEAKEAHIGLTGGTPNLIYIDGKPAQKLTNDNLVDELEKLIRQKAAEKVEADAALIARG